MNTDRFSDSIRRKLESIRPDFSEKDWKRMQATLQQATPPPPGSLPASQPFTGSAWSAQPWLLAAAAVSTVVLVSLAVWQRNQIADLRQTVSQLTKQQMIRPGQTPAETATPNAIALRPNQKTARRSETRPGSRNQPTDRNQPTASQPDTVYVTRYVAVPAQPAKRVEPERAMANAQPQQRQSTRPATADSGNGEAETTSDPNNDGADKASPVANSPTTNNATNAAGNRPGPTNRTTRRTDEKTATEPVGLSEKPSGLLGKNGRSRKKRPSVTSTTDAGALVAATTDNSGSTNSGQTTATPAGSSDGATLSETGQPTTASALTTRPLTMKPIDWNEALARQSRRMRPARTTTVGGQEAPVSQPVSQPVNRVALGFRIGAGGELSRTVRSGGLLTELLIGKHLTLGVGLGLASFAGGTFTNDEKFDQRKQHKLHKPIKFRRDYTPGLSPLSAITNIGVHTTRLQIPVSLGYRIPVSPTLSLLPSVGTTLGFQSKEFVTFTYRQPFRNVETEDSRQYDRPVDLLNNLTFGAGAEWKRNHWVVQAGPLLTVPVVADANWEESTSVGLRARLFYQF